MGDPGGATIAPPGTCPVIGGAIGAGCDGAGCDAAAGDGAAGWGFGWPLRGGGGGAISSDEVIAAAAGAAGAVGVVVESSEGGGGGVCAAGGRCVDSISAKSSLVSGAFSAVVVALISISGSDVSEAIYISLTSVACPKYCNTTAPLKIIVYFQPQTGFYLSNFGAFRLPRQTSPYPI